MQARDRAMLALCTAGGIGRSPVAPGTLGSLPPVALALALLALGADPLLIDGALVLVAVAASAACLAFVPRLESLLARRDPPGIVADEVAGQSLALLFLPWSLPGSDGAIARNLLLAGGAFVLFRLFDIVKPPPIRGVQSIDGGVGVLVDDLLAGAAALLCLHGALALSS